MATDFYTNEDGFVQYIASENQTKFEFDFTLRSVDEVDTYVNGVEINENSVFLYNNNEGGYVLIPATNNGDIVTLRRNIDSARVTNFNSTGYITAELLNKEFNNMAREIGQVQHELNRKVGLIPTTKGSDVDTTLPNPVAEKVLGWNEEENKLVNVSVTTEEQYDVLKETVDALVDKVEDLEPLGDGVWVEGKMFTAYNQYLRYEGLRYEPRLSTPLPYTTTAVPDNSKVAVVGEEADTILREYLTLKIFQSPTDGGLTEIQTRTVEVGEVYEVRNTSDGEYATIYSDASGTTEIVQNGTSNKSDNTGTVEFFVADGSYYVEVGGVQNNFRAGLPASAVSFSGRTQEDKNNEILTIADFGEVGGTNASPAINAMVQELGYFRLPVGDFKVQDQIIIPETTHYNSIWKGEGMSKSTLRASGMGGSSLITTEKSDMYVRLSMRDFAITGDLDTCIDISLQEAGGWQLYNSDFQNLVLTSQGGDAFIADRHFSTKWDGVHFSSSGGNAVNLQGGNSTVLINCYAHLVGQGYAGYRIKGNAIMIACNGIDEQNNDAWWGHFGSLSENQAYNIQILGGNAEDWNLGVAKLENFGWLTIDGQTAIQRNHGEWYSYLDAINGSSHKVVLRGRTGYSSKGATFADTYPVPIVSSGSMTLKHESINQGSALSKFYNKAQDLVYDGVEEVVSNVEFGKQGLITSAVRSSRDSSYRIPQTQTITADTSTFVITGINSLKTANTSARTLNNLTGGEDGQEVTLLIKDSFTTIKDSFAAAGRFKLKSGADEIASNGDVYRFVVNSGNLVQI